MSTVSDGVRCPLPVNVSLGAYGRRSHLLAIADMLAQPPVDPLLGTLSLRKVQLCPQNAGVLGRDTAADLCQTLPGIEWRLHANVRVGESHRVVDLCDWRQELSYFRELAAVSAALAAPVYTAHAGRRAKASVAQVLDYAREAAQLFGCSVGIEGHYPSPNDVWLFSCWEEYRILLESGVPYALDLSHLNIVAAKSGRRELALVQELLASPACLEVHLSGNDGTADQHLPLDALNPPWWFSLLSGTNPSATVFSEGRLYSAAMPATPSSNATH